MQLDKMLATRKVQQGHERLLWVDNGPLFRKFGRPLFNLSRIPSVILYIPITDWESPRIEVLKLYFIGQILPDLPIPNQ
jgi:hypothetical protein